MKHMSNCRESSAQLSQVINGDEEHVLSLLIPCAPFGQKQALYATGSPCLRGYFASRRYFAA